MIQKCFVPNFYYLEWIPPRLSSEIQISRCIILIEKRKSTFCLEFFKDQNFCFENSIIRKNNALSLVGIRLHPIIKIKPPFCLSQFTEFNDININIKILLKTCWIRHLKCQNLQKFAKKIDWFFNFRHSQVFFTLYRFD